MADPNASVSGITEQVNMGEGPSSNDEQWVDESTRQSGTKDPVADADDKKS